jgi:hypothetical protein
MPSTVTAPAPAALRLRGTISTTAALNAAEPTFEPACSSSKALIDGAEAVSVRQRGEWLSLASADFVAGARRRPAAATQVTSDMATLAAGICSHSATAVRAPSKAACAAVTFAVRLPVTPQIKAAKSGPVREIRERSAQALVPSHT